MDAVFENWSGTTVSTLLNVCKSEVKMYFVYILESQKDKKFYTGFSRDLQTRFDEHKRGGVSSTKDRRPLKLVYYEACLSQDDAIHREKYLKSYHGKMFIRRRIKSYLTG